MAKPRVIRTVRLRIKNQARIVNQIAGTYKDVYRAMMEYVDNSADAAALDVAKPRHLQIAVDQLAREVCFTDDCAGMTPEQLGALLESIGASTKAHLPWVNGEFGFGVHAFRAFTQYLEVTSRVAGGLTSRIVIDREADEKQPVPIEEATSSAIPTSSGTRIRVFGFRSGVFKGPYFASSLRREIEDHFDDVIQNGILQISIKDAKARTYDVCKPVEVGSLAGTPIRVSRPVETEAGVRVLEVDAKLVEGSPFRHPIILTRNGRRVLAVGELRSFRGYLRANERLPDIWGHPQLTGRIEIGEIASPNISRDDLQPSEGRDALYEALSAVQAELEGAVAASEGKHREKELESASKVLSERLAHVMRKFSALFRRPAAGSGQSSTGGADGEKTSPGGDLPGGGGPGATPGAGGSKETGSGGRAAGAGGLGESARGAHAGDGSGEAAGGEGISSGGPELSFAHLDPSIRCQLVGYKITVNLDHPAYLARVSRGGLDERILGHIARVISPPLTQKLYESKSEIPLPLEFGERVVELGIMLEDDFMAHEEEIVLAIRTSEVA